MKPAILAVVLLPAASAGNAATLLTPKVVFNVAATSSAVFRCEAFSVH
jgi:hypothetical protein